MSLKVARGLEGSEPLSLCANYQVKKRGGSGQGSRLTQGKGMTPFFILGTEDRISRNEKSEEHFEGGRAMIDRKKRCCVINISDTNETK